MTMTSSRPRGGGRHRHPPRRGASAATGGPTAASAAPRAPSRPPRHLLRPPLRRARCHAASPTPGLIRSERVRPRWPPGPIPCPIRSRFPCPLQSPTVGPATIGGPCCPVRCQRSSGPRRRQRDDLRRRVRRPMPTATNGFLSPPASAQVRRRPSAGRRCTDDAQRRPSDAGDRHESTGPSGGSSGRRRHRRAAICCIRGRRRRHEPTWRLPARRLRSRNPPAGRRRSAILDRGCAGGQVCAQTIEVVEVLGASKDRFFETPRLSRSSLSDADRATFDRSVVCQSAPQRPASRVSPGTPPGRDPRARGPRRGRPRPAATNTGSGRPPGRPLPVSGAAGGRCRP